MKVLLSAQMKGGSGKTCVATNLAGSLPGLTVLVDMDPQATSHDFTTFREKRGISPSIFAVKSTANDLKGYLDRARKHGAAWAVIDTSPASDAAILEAAKHADVIVIPSLVNIGDIMAAKTTIRLLKGFNVPQFVVLNCVETFFGFPARRKQAVDAILRFGGNVPDIYFPKTVKFPDAQAAGKTVIEFAPTSLAANQVRALGHLAVSSVAA